MERKILPVDVTKVKSGDLMAFTYWTKVKENLDQGIKVLRVTDINNNSVFEIRGKDLIESGMSADQFHETQKVSKTIAAQILIDSFNIPFTVSFVKQNGEERVLRGRLIKHEALMGRSMVEDLDATDKKNNIKQVDHRSINYLIISGVKYEVK